MADTRDLNSLAERRAGSSPAWSTMGYYTDIRVIEAKNRTKNEVIHAVNDFVARQKEMSNYHPINTEPYKWYERTEHLALFTREQPTVHFVLVGIGENSGDEWIMFVGEGLVMQHPLNTLKIEYPEWW